MTLATPGVTVWVLMGNRVSYATPMLEELFQRCADSDPALHAACYPRRIQPPGNCFNPKWYATALFTGAHLYFAEEWEMLPHTSIALNTAMLLTHSVPTYFVERSFAEAVAATEVPEGFRFADLKLGLPSMLFVLPNEFVQGLFGAHVPFMSISRVPAGTYPGAVKMPDCGFNWQTAHPIQVSADQVTMHFPRFSRTEVPDDLAAIYPATEFVSKIATSNFIDSDYLTNWMGTAEMVGIGLVPGGNPIMAATAPAGRRDAKAADHELTKRLASFLIKLVLVLSAAPEHVRHGEPRERRSKTGPPLSREALWSPNVIGFEKTAGQPTGLERDGRSPRLGWRRRHLRHQAFGPRADVVSIRELPKAADGKVNWAEVPQDTLDRFWACHELKWIAETLVTS